MTRDEIDANLKALREKKKEMEDEIKVLEEQALTMKKEEEAENIRFLRNNRDLVLSLIDHSRTSCSDDNPINGYDSDRGYARCDKCHLIEILDGQYDDGDFNVSFNVNISRVC